MLSLTHGKRLHRIYNTKMMSVRSPGCLKDPGLPSAGIFRNRFVCREAREFFNINGNRKNPAILSVFFRSSFRGDLSLAFFWKFRLWFGNLLWNLQQFPCLVELAVFRDQDSTDHLMTVI